MTQDCEDSSKKRKRDGSFQPEDFFTTKINYSKRLVLDTELHIDTRMPSEWQRCLDIESGEIHYYNIRTHKKTSMDPRGSSIEPTKNMSLDLELNLPCGSFETTKKQHVADNFSKFKISSTTIKMNIGGGDGGGLAASSLLALEGGDQQQEMMTAVCKKCHMLVMMFKISPSCPNCKFMHRLNKTPPSLFNREISLLC